MPAPNRGSKGTGVSRAKSTPCREKIGRLKLKWSFGFPGAQTAFGTPTYNPRGWKGPCYVITDHHYGSYRELIEQTQWENYGPGNDPRCAADAYGS